MYNLGEQFARDYNAAKPNEKSVIQGNKYRFTILTESLIRIEYNKDGVFEDRPTELVWYRNFETPPFQIKQDSRYLELETKYFKLYYTKEQDVRGTKLNPTANLRIELKNTDRTWYFGHPEIRNYGTSSESLEAKSKKQITKKGLFSGDGFVSIDDSKSKVLSETGNLIDKDLEEVDTYVFFYLNDFAVCLKDYYQITGYPALIPRFALGNWWSRNISYDDMTLRKLILDFKENNIPLSVLLLNDDWHLNTYQDKKTKTGFTWNEEYFKSPHSMIKYLHNNGIRIGLNISPEKGFYPYEEYYEKAKEYLGTQENDVIPFNVYDPKVVDVYLKLFIHPLQNMDVDFFWLDYDSKVSKEELWAINHYQFYDMNRNYKSRPMLLTKNSGIAEHRYPVLYSGPTTVSWKTLEAIPLYNANAANMGVSWWSHDIGGFHNGIEDNELYTRFVQLGVFSPILKFGSEKGRYYKREPWRWGIKTYSIVRDYLQLRHRLIPYLYAESYKYHKQGTPLLQPLYYKNPEMYDDVIYRNEYFLGSELFVCPIVKPKDFVMNRVIHKFFIPEGIWYDFVTGKKFPGGRNYVSFFRDEDYPVFARSGAIIVLGNNENINDTNPPVNMEIHIFPGRNNTYYLYEDDGVSDLYRKDFYLLTSIDYNYLPNNYTVIIRAVEGKNGIVPERRNYKLRFRNTKQADDVIIYFNDSKIESTSYTEGPDFIVEIKDVSTIGQLTVNCKGKDIEIDAVRLINEDISHIISDLQITTSMKEQIDAVLFSDLPIKKKRIAIRKLRSKGLEPKFIKLFLKLLEYIEQV